MIIKAIKEWFEAWLRFAWLWFLYIVSSERSGLQQEYELEANSAYLHYPEKRVVSGREVYLQTVLVNSSVKPVPKKEEPKRSKNSSVVNIIKRFEKKNSEPSEVTPEIRIISESKSILQPKVSTDKVFNNTNSSSIKATPILCKRSEILGHEEEDAEELAIEPSSLSDNTDSLWEELVARYAADETAKECDALKSRLVSRLSSFERTDSVKSEEGDIDGKLQKYLSRLDNDSTADNSRADTNDTREIELDLSNIPKICDGEKDENQIFIIIEDDSSDAKCEGDKTSSESSERQEQSDYGRLLKSYETELNLADVLQVEADIDISKQCSAISSELLINGHVSCDIDGKGDTAGGSPHWGASIDAECDNVDHLVDKEFEVLCQNLDEEETDFDKILATYIETNNHDECQSRFNVYEMEADQSHIVYNSDNSEDVILEKEIKQIDQSIHPTEVAISFEKNTNENIHQFRSEISKSPVRNDLLESTIELDGGKATDEVCESNIAEKERGIMHNPVEQTTVDSHCEIVDILPEYKLHIDGTMCQDTSNEEVARDLEVIKCDISKPPDNASPELRNESYIYDKEDSNNECRNKLEDISTAEQLIDKDENCAIFETKDTASSIIEQTREWKNEIFDEQEPRDETDEMEFSIVEQTRERKNETADVEEPRDETDEVEFSIIEQTKNETGDEEELRDETHEVEFSIIEQKCELINETADEQEPRVETDEVEFSIIEQTRDWNNETSDEQEPRDETDDVEFSIIEQIREWKNETADAQEPRDETDELEFSEQCANEEINNMNEEDLSRQIEMILKGLSQAEPDFSIKNTEQRLSHIFNIEVMEGNEFKEESFPCFNEDSLPDEVILPEITEEIKVPEARCCSPQFLEQSDISLGDGIDYSNLLVNPMPDINNRGNSKFSLEDIPEENEIDEELISDDDDADQNKMSSAAITTNLINIRKDSQRVDIQCDDNINQITTHNDIPEYLDDVKDLLIPRARRKKAKKFKELEDILKVDEPKLTETPIDSRYEKDLQTMGVDEKYLCDEPYVSQESLFASPEKDGDALVNFTEEEQEELKEIKKEQADIRASQRREIEKYLAMPCALTDQEQTELQEILAEEESEKILTAASEARLMAFLSDVRNRLGHYSDEEDNEGFDDYLKLPMSLSKDEELFLADDTYEVSRHDFNTDDEYKEYVQNKYLDELEEDRLRVEEDYENNYDYDFSYDDTEMQEVTNTKELIYEDLAIGTEKTSNSPKKKRNKKLKNYLGFVSGNSTKNSMENNDNLRDTSNEPLPKDTNISGNSKTKFFRCGSLRKKRKKKITEFPDENDNVDPNFTNSGKNVINENSTNLPVIESKLESCEVNPLTKFILSIRNVNEEHHTAGDSLFSTDANDIHDEMSPYCPDSIDLFSKLPFSMFENEKIHNTQQNMEEIQSPTNFLSFPLSSVENFPINGFYRSQCQIWDNRNNPFPKSDHIMSTGKGFRRNAGSEVVSSVDQDSLECLSSVSPAFTNSPSLSPNPTFTQQTSLQDIIDAEIAARLGPQQDSLEENNSEIHDLHNQSYTEAVSISTKAVLLETSNKSLDSLTSDLLVGNINSNVKVSSEVMQNGHSHEKHLISEGPQCSIFLTEPSQSNDSTANEDIYLPSLGKSAPAISNSSGSSSLERSGKNSSNEQTEYKTRDIVQQEEETLANNVEMSLNVVDDVEHSSISVTDQVSLNSVDNNQHVKYNESDDSKKQIDTVQETGDIDRVENHDGILNSLEYTNQENIVLKANQYNCISNDENCTENKITGSDNDLKEITENGMVEASSSAEIEDKKVIKEQKKYLPFDVNAYLESLGSPSRFNDTNTNAKLISSNVLESNTSNGNESLDVNEENETSSLDASVNVTNNDGIKSPMLDEFEKMEQAVEEAETKNTTNGVHKKRKDGEKKKKRKKKKPEAEKENKKTVIQSRDAIYEKHVGPRVRSFDTAKMKSKFNNPKEVNPVSSECRICGKAVFQMEKIVAEKASWHKNCFRCNECNKQMTLETYQSHEGTLYCRPHFKDLFRPKAVIQNEDEERKDRLLRRPRMIVLESQPEILSDDIIRATAKPDYGLEELQSLNVRQRFSMFENADRTEEAPKLETISVQRSQSLMSKAARFYEGDEDRNGLDFDEEEEEEMDEESEDEVDGEMNGVVKSRRRKERPMSFSGIGDLKNAWEQKNRREEMTHARKEEVGRFRQLLCAGKNNALKEMFENGNFETEDDDSKERVMIEVSHGAKLLRDRFEKGQPFIMEEENMNGDTELLYSKNYERNEVDEIFKEADTAKKARNVFKQIDSAVSKEGAPVMRSKSFAPTTRDNRCSQDVSFLALQMSPSTAEVIKAHDKQDDFQVDTTDLASRFNFFANYEKQLDMQQQKSTKVFRITPPREGVDQVEPLVEAYMPKPCMAINCGVCKLRGMKASENVEVGRDPNLIKCTDKYEDDVDCRNTKNILQMFRNLEMAKEEDAEQDEPRPLKRFTPPPEGDNYQGESGDDDDDDEYSDEEYTDEDSEEGQEEEQPKYKDEILEMLSAKKAAHLRARFERYESEIESRNSQDQESEEYRPSLDTARNLKAMFEHKAVEESKPILRNPSFTKVNRFV